jgi:hypothetical protein
MTSSSTDDKMKAHISSEQLESKYGGDEDDLNVFWPPTLNSNDVFVAGDIPSQILSTN